MKFITSIVAIGAMLSTTLAAPVARRDLLAFTNGDYTGLTVGMPLAITWSGNAGAVTVNLKSGSSDDLRTIGTVACKLLSLSPPAPILIQALCGLFSSHLYIYFTIFSSVLS